MSHFYTINPHTHAFAFSLAILGAVLFGLAILALLQIMPSKLRKPMIALVTFLGGLYYAAEFFIPINPKTQENFLTPYFDFVANLSNNLVCLSVGLGIISLIGLHLQNVSKQRKGWGFSIALLVSFVLMAVFTLLNEYAKKIHIFTHTTAGDVYALLFNGGLVSLDSAMFALIGFFIISSSYRAFRIRSIEASMMMISAIIVMLGQVTLGSALTHSLPTHGYWAFFRLENMSEYILVHINSPAQRAVTFGLALGMLATSLRLWLSLERGLYFDQAE
jgi:hypothetical protein